LIVSDEKHEPEIERKIKDLEATTIGASEYTPGFIKISSPAFAFANARTKAHGCEMLHEVGVGALGETKRTWLSAKARRRQMRKIFTEKFIASLE